MKVGSTLATLIIAGSISGITPETLHAQGTGAEADIRATVQEFEAAWKAGDVERLRAVLAPKGVVVWTSGSGTDAAVASMTFDELLKNRKAQEVYDLERILSVNVVDDQLADVDVEIRSTNGRYRDHYILYRVGGRWLIATKSFVYFPDKGS